MWDQSSGSRKFQSPATIHCPSLPTSHLFCYLLHSMPTRQYGGWSDWVLANHTNHRLAKRYVPQTARQQRKSKGTGIYLSCVKFMNTRHAGSIIWEAYLVVHASWRIIEHNLTYIWGMRRPIVSNPGLPLIFTLEKAVYLKINLIFHKSLGTKMEFAQRG